jgi:flagellar motility protein MotE (MotC chaperone)
MLNRITTPRLLPSTIAVMAVLFVVKLGVVAQALLIPGRWPDSAVVTPALAASEGAPAKLVGHPVAGGAPPSLRAPAATVKAHAAPAEAAAAPSRDGAAPVSDSERSLLQDLRQRRKQLDQQADTLKAREAVLGAAEQKLSVKVTELQALQQKLEALDAAQKQKEQAAWGGMAKLYEAMRPRDAATIFNDLSMPVLLQVLNRMRDAKAAAVMAAMKPDKARDVTAELARMRLGHDPAAAADDFHSPQAGG